MKNTKITLQSICEKFCKINNNEDNYDIGGGLDGVKFASRRHEDAKNDIGKLTMGEAAQLFKKATGFEISTINEIIEYAIPNMEWHHAGKLPKSYGGGMKKTYFLNASEICKLACGWDEYILKLELSKQAAKDYAEKKKNFGQLKLEFLKSNATYIQRQPEIPYKNFYMTKREINGKYGWFDSSCKSYNMPEYFSGWVFENSEKYFEFLNLKCD